MKKFNNFLNKNKIDENASRNISENISIEREFSKSDNENDENLSLFDDNKSKIKKNIIERITHLLSFKVSKSFYNEKYKNINIKNIEINYDKNVNKNIQEEYKIDIMMSNRDHIIARYTKEVSIEKIIKNNIEIVVNDDVKYNINDDNFTINDMINIVYSVYKTYLKNEKNYKQII